MIQWVLIVYGLGLAVLPLACSFFHKFPTRGIGYVKPLGLLIAGTLVWLLPALHLLPYSRGMAWATLASVAVTVWGLYGRAFLRGLRRLPPGSLVGLLLPELVFVLAVLWQGYTLALNPSISFSEKPTNFGFVNAINRSAWFPPENPWFSGHALNYYYLGHVLLALVLRLSDVPPAVGFSLAGITSFGMVVAVIFSLVFDTVILQRSDKRILVAAAAGFGAVALALFTGNLVPLVQLVRDPAIRHQWWSQGELNWWTLPYHAHGSLSELPWRTYMLNYLHSLDLALPFALLAFAWALRVWQSPAHSFSSPPRTAWLVTLALLLSGTALISPWVLPAPALVVGGLILRDLFKNPGAKNSGAWLFRKSHAPTTAAPTAHPALDAGHVARYPVPDVQPTASSFWKHWARASLRPLLEWTACLLGAALPLALFARTYHSPENLLRLDQSAATGMALPTFFLQFGVKLVCLALVLAVRFSSIQSRRFWVTLASIAAAIGLLVLASTIGAATGIMLFLWLALVLLGVHHLHESGALPFSLFVLFVAQSLDLFPFLFTVHDSPTTFFKFGFVAWVVGAVGIFMELGTVWGTSILGRQAARRDALTLLVVTLFVGSWMPALGTATITTWLRGRGVFTLDPVTPYLDRVYPAENEAIRWLAAHAEDGEVVLEATGPAFTPAGRVSSFTGLPTVINWYTHQLLWHEGQPEVLAEIQQRIEDVNRIYATLDPDEARRLLEKYGVVYVFVGGVERGAVTREGVLELHWEPAALAKFAAFMDVVYPPSGQFEGSDVVIYRTRAARRK